MAFLRLFPRVTWRKVVWIAAVIFLGLPLTVYAALLAGNALSAWRISRVLNRLEKIRVGDPAATLFKTIEGCAMKQSGSEYDCQIYHFPLQFQWLDAAFAKLPDEVTWDERLRHLGLREHYLSISATIDHERVQRISVGLMVAGRYESMGSQWEIAEHIPERHLDASSPEEDPRTFMNWFHITSSRPGEGFHLYVTPRSTPPELQARHANLHCLFSFRGCDGLCELMPDAMPVLKQRNRGFGGCTNVPRSPCELPSEHECRKGFGD
jgi:hypothetical protein